MSCSHVCSVRDRRHRFPSLIDAFLSVHDRFHFRFDRFLDRFRFLKHDDDDDLVSLFVLLLLETIGFSLSLLLSIFFTHTQKTRVVVPQKKSSDDRLLFCACFCPLSLSLSLSFDACVRREREKRERLKSHTTTQKCVDELTQKLTKAQATRPFFFMKP